MQAFTLALFLATTLVAATALPRGEEKVVMIENLLHEILNEQGEQEEMEDSGGVEDDLDWTSSEQDEEEDSANQEIMEDAEALLQELKLKIQNELQQKAKVEGVPLEINTFSTQFKQKVESDKSEQELLDFEVPDTTSKNQGLKNFFSDGGKLEASIKGLGVKMDFFLGVNDNGELEAVVTDCSSTNAKVSIKKMTGNSFVGDWVYDSFHKTVKDTIKKEVGAKQLCEIKKNEMTKRANGVLRSLSDQNKGLVKAFLIATYGPNCITELEVSAQTGDKKYAGFKENKVHHVVLQLEDKELKGDIEGEIKRKEPVGVELGLPFDLKAGSQCIKRSDIREVRLEAGSKDGWYISKITTYITMKNGENEVLTDNPGFSKWLDNDKKKKSRRSYVLNMVDSGSILINKKELQSILNFKML